MNAKALRQGTLGIFGKLKEASVGLWEGEAGEAVGVVERGVGSEQVQSQTSL